MTVSLKKFVNIDIEKHVSSAVSGTRNTVVLFTSYGTEGTIRTINNMDEATTYYTSSADTKAYLKVFFDNGGVKVRVIEGISSLSASVIKALADEYICCAQVCGTTNVAKKTNYDALKTIAQSLESDSTVYGINEKLILTSVYKENDDTDAALVIENANTKNFIVKSSSIQGAEMTIAAYLSRINVYDVDSIYDYMYTAESIDAENISTEDYDLMITDNMNVNLQLAGASRACGGNCSDGADIVNNYVRIILHQTLTQQLLLLLTQKIKNNSGIGRIYGTISQELERYRTSGYLSTDKIWTDEAWKITGNDGKTYTIIDKGTALNTGYKVVVLPLSSLTAAEKTLHKAPAVYVVIADQYGIRSITINGEII